MHQNQGLDWTSDIRSEKGLFGILAGEEQPSRTPPTGVRPDWLSQARGNREETPALRRHDNYVANHRDVNRSEPVAHGGSRLN